MYLPEIFVERRIEVLHRLIHSHPFGVLVIASHGELDANHVPFQIIPNAGPYGTLRAHVSRANPLRQRLAGPVEALAVFQGPHAYITPSWYPSRHADGKAVPTWNYAAVHAYGRPRAIEDRAWLLEHVTALTDQQEAGRAAPWRVRDAPAEFIEQMITRIVGIEIPLSRIEGKWKVSQNRKPADRLGVAEGLESSGSDACRAMAALVRERAAG